MADHKITITATPSKVKQINVTSNTVANEIVATPDTSLYYSNLSRQWATKMDGLVVGEDYSSKYYAENARINAETAKMEASTVNGLIPELQENFNNYNSILNETADNAITEINTNRDYAITQVNTTSTEAVSIVEQTASKAVSDVGTLSGEAVSEINTSKNTALSEITQEAQKQIDNIESTGFYMRDDKLYFINSEGVETEFESGSGLDNKITNCITEIPQDIKLELNNGALTVKAGSNIYVPNGFEANGTTPKFDKVVIESDISIPLGTAETRLVCFDSKGQNFISSIISSYCSGNTATIYNGGRTTWYDTASNLIKTSTDKGVTWTGNYSLPIAMYTATSVNGVVQITSIDQVFNGWGYIGEHLWLTNIKALISDGRNEDGTCKNIEVAIPKIAVYKFSNIDIKRVVYLKPDGRLDFISGANVFESTIQPNYTQTYSNKWYNPDTNKTYAFDGTKWNESPSIKLFTYEPYNSDKKTVRILDDRFPFRVADYYETVQKSSLAEVQCVVETYKNGDSWYRVYSDGWCEQGGYTSNAITNGMVIKLLKPYSTANYNVITTQCQGSSAANSAIIQLYNQTNTGFTVTASTAGVKGYWRACGYIAER